MPTITVDLGDLRRLIGRDLEESAIAGHLALVKGEIAGRDPAKGKDAVRIELQDTNRPDLWCPEGIARQVRAKIEGKLAGRERYAAAFENAPAPGLTIDADAAMAAIRPIVAGFVVTGVTIDDAGLVGFVQTQEKLADNFGRRRESVSIGIYDASKIAFPVKYAAVPRDGGVRFTPLGMDAPMTPGEVLEKHPKGIEHRAILDKGGARAKTVPMLIDAKGVVLSFPPIINSRELGEVKPGDSHLFVEATGHDAHAVMLAINILAANMTDRGGKIARVTTRYPYDTALGRDVAAPRPLGRAQSATVKVRDVARFMGVEVTAKEVADRLAEYGVETKATKAGDELVASIPPWRADYLHGVDVVEDYAIAKGFAAFEAILPDEWTPGRLAPQTELEDHLRDRMIGFGFEEIISNVLANRELQRAKMRLGPEAAPAGAEDAGPDTPVGVPPREGARLVRIVNPASETWSVVRDFLVPSLLRVEAASPKATYPHRVFEAGEVAVPDPAENQGSRTERRLGALIAHEKASFSEVQVALDLLLYYLDIPYELETAPDHPSFIPGRLGLVKAGKAGAARVVGFIGEIHPEVLERWGIRAPVAVFEVVQDLIAPLARG